MRAQTRLKLLSLRRWALRLAAVPLVCAALLWLYLQLDARTLAGVSVAGTRLPPSRDPHAALAQRAAAWAEQKVRIETGPHVTAARRSDLGARLSVDAVQKRVLQLGHSGNPFVDLGTAWQAWTHGIDLSWTPSLDRAQLGRYVRAIRNRVERPPVAGTVDQAGVTIGGVDGVTLDVISSAAELERVLRAGGLRVEAPLRHVPAPPPVAIGSPDGIEDHEPSALPFPLADTGRPPEVDSPRMRAAQPREWLPSQGCEPMDPPYEHFCQGPRQVPMPWGADAELAERLGLGSIETVGRLLNDRPRPEWVAAAGGPRAANHSVLWPVGAGRLWRRFGYVRKPPFEHLLHRGIDVGAPRGAAIVAVDDGIVAYSDNRVRGYGNLLVIVHDDASVSFSAHCRAIYVFAGQRVRRGQVVAEVGDTGLARGTHVHWEYHVAGQPVDPAGKFSFD